MNEHPDIEELRQSVKDDLSTEFGPDARVKVYEQGERLDVHLNPAGVIRYLADRHDATVSTYSDLKLTITIDR